MGRWGPVECVLCNNRSRRCETACIRRPHSNMISFYSRFRRAILRADVSLVRHLFSADSGCVIRHYFDSMSWSHLSRLTTLRSSSTAPSSTLFSVKKMNWNSQRKRKRDFSQFPQPTETHGTISRNYEMNNETRRVFRIQTMKPNGYRNDVTNKMRKRKKSRFFLLAFWWAACGSVITTTWNQAFGTHTQTPTLLANLIFVYVPVGTAQTREHPNDVYECEPIGGRENARDFLSSSLCLVRSYWPLRVIQWNNTN